MASAAVWKFKDRKSKESLDSLESFCHVGLIVLTSTWPLACSCCEAIIWWHGSCMVLGPISMSHPSF